MLKVLEVALAEVGYLEKASNSDLDSKTGNAGSGNFTKYARDIDRIAGFYNGPKQGFAWCDVFVDWCFVEAYGADMAKRLLCQPDKSGGAGCYYSAQYYKQAGQFYFTPKVGDQIFFNYGGEVGHTGLVYAIDSSFVYTVEGNTSGASGVIPNGGGVCKKSYSRGYSAIYGYGRPNYDLVNDSSKNDDETNDSGKVVDTEMPLIKNGSKGRAVYVWQAILGFTGNNLDGEFGPYTEKKTKEFQGKHKLKIDGIVGKQSWKAGLESV